MLLKPLPWPEPERLVRLEERRGGRPGRVPWTITNGTYLAWTEAATVENVGGWMSVTSTFSDGREPERIRLGRLTPTVFTVLQARALMGRVFEAARRGAAGRHRHPVARHSGSAASAGRPTSLAAPSGSMSGPTR